MGAAHANGRSSLNLSRMLTLLDFKASRNSCAAADLAPDRISSQASAARAATAAAAAAAVAIPGGSPPGATGPAAPSDDDGRGRARTLGRRAAHSSPAGGALASDYAWGT